MTVPFISRDRRAEILNNLVSDGEDDDSKDAKTAYNKLYSKEQQKDAKDHKDQKDQKDEKDYDDLAYGGVTSGVDEIIRAAAADATATDEAAGLSVGAKWVDAAELRKRDPVV